MTNESEPKEEAGRILVVDDYPMNRMTLSHLLQQLGHTVTMAQNGTEALEIMRSDPFDLVLLDIIMPEMDGYLVLERMKSDSELRDIPVIVISAVDEIDSVVKCIEIGAEDFLPKPFNPTLLKARLRTTLQRKRLRDLEKAYLRQEIMLRQSEKLATLGKLSAGMAHEMNNPAAAAKRSSEQLRSTMATLQRASRDLYQTSLSQTQMASLEAMEDLARAHSSMSHDLDPITRSDRETDLEGWLERRAIGEAWEWASALASQGWDVSKLESLLAGFEESSHPLVIGWFCATCTVYWLLRDIGTEIESIVSLVKALKTYSYMDQAPVQDVDLNRGLEDTLTMLRAKLSGGTTVRREYAEGLPLIQAHGSELNQVWTNLIDNAIDAMKGRGELVLRTRREGEWVVVEVEDNGPGIPEDVRQKVFDPFFTTKAPGKGTGLGLNITHNIVVQKHHGKIDVHSRPGRTVFEVRLPVQADNSAVNPSRRAA